MINSYIFNTKANVNPFRILMYEMISGKLAYNDLLHGEKMMNEFQFIMKVIEDLGPKFDLPNLPKYKRCSSFTFKARIYSN